MAAATPSYLARARTDAQDRLVEADEPLAGLHQRCGGELPGTVAIPELLELVRKSRTFGLRLGRTIQAIDGEDVIKFWVEVAPEGKGGGEGCTIGLTNWQAVPMPAENEQMAAERRIAIDRQLAELTARLDPRQGLLTVESEAPDLRQTVAKMRKNLGMPWTEFVEFEGNPHRQPLHWRLLDGARCRIAGSPRVWIPTLIPLGSPEPGSAGFELLLIADGAPAAADPPVSGTSNERDTAPALGRELAPVLRQPIARIIANAETIRTRLAGPLADEYSAYAADIAAAGQHLLALIEDLADLEVVESADFSAAADRIDLADVARRTAGILAVRARGKAIAIDAPEDGQSVLAIGEFRRVMQVLLNLVGNAINYAPEGSRVAIELGSDGDRARITVSDQGQGLSDDQQAVVFDKFERLGRGGDGGSGLGLYIARSLARAMGGDLTAASTPGEGARFTLTLPAFDDRRAKPR